MAPFEETMTVEVMTDYPPKIILIGPDFRIEWPLEESFIDGMIESLMMASLVIARHNFLNGVE
jgi:hypothetical protein